MASNEPIEESSFSSSLEADLSEQCTTKNNEQLSVSQMKKVSKRNRCIFSSSLVYLNQRYVQFCFASFIYYCLIKANKFFLFAQHISCIFLWNRQFIVVLSKLEISIGKSLLNLNWFLQFCCQITPVATKITPTPVY